MNIEDDNYMKCILMNKNVEVLIAEYNTILKASSEIYKIKNINYAPLILKNIYNVNKEDI